MSVIAMIVGCLDKLVRVTEITCPKCHRSTEVPSSGVTALIVNFSLLELIYSTYQDSIHHYTIRPSTTSCPDTTLLSSAPPPSSSVMNEVPVISGSSRSPQHLSNAPFCQEHGDHLTSYCEEDNMLVCSSCMVYGSHKHHSCKPVLELAHEYRRTFHKITPCVSQQVDTVKAGMDEVTSIIKDVKENSEKLSNEIDAHFDVLIGILDRRRRKMKLDVLHRSQGKSRVTDAADQVRMVEVIVQYYICMCLPSQDDEGVSG